jgi:hypothetical protein
LGPVLFSGNRKHNEKRKKNTEEKNTLLCTKSPSASEHHFHFIVCLSLRVHHARNCTDVDGGVGQRWVGTQTHSSENHSCGEAANLDWTWYCFFDFVCTISVFCGGRGSARMALTRFFILLHIPPHLITCGGKKAQTIRRRGQYTLFRKKKVLQSTIWFEPLAQVPSIMLL